jgi:hypothetical protein
VFGSRLKGHGILVPGRTNGDQASEGLDLRQSATLVDGRGSPPEGPADDGACKREVERAALRSRPIDECKAGRTIEMGARVAGVEKGVSPAVDSIDEIKVPYAVGGAVRRRCFEGARKGIPCSVRRLEDRELKRGSRPRCRVLTNRMPDRARFLPAVPARGNRGLDCGACLLLG